jgi:hypothetical protein
MNRHHRHQRVDAISNAHAGREFEAEAVAYFAAQGLSLTEPFSAPVGVGERRKAHRFDLGGDDPAVLVECKSHTWTSTGNVPSAKLTVWNEAMFYFHLAPTNFRKILFVLEARHPRRTETLADYYIRTYGHMIPDDVSIIEFDPITKTAVTKK